MLFLGVDGGNSKTLAVLMNGDGAVIGRGIAGPSNLNTSGREAVLDSLSSAITRAAWHSGIERVRLDSAFLGMGGAVTPEDRKELRKILAECNDCPVVEVHHDAYTALAGAVHDHVGVVLLAGVGSCAYGRGPAGEEALVGGWGHAFSDEGSAYDIARRALAYVARSWDGRVGRTMLAERLADALGVKRPREIVAAVYHQRRDRVASIAALAPIVTQAADEGDAMAQRILSKAASDLADMVAAVAEQLDLPGEWPLVLSGGVFRGGQAILDPLKEELAKRIQGYSMHLPRFDGAVGAAMLAAELCGVRVLHPSFALA